MSAAQLSAALTTESIAFLSDEVAEALITTAAEKGGGAVTDVLKALIDTGQRDRWDGGRKADREPGGYQRGLAARDRTGEGRQTRAGRHDLPAQMTRGS